MENEQSSEVYISQHDINSIDVYQDLFVLFRASNLSSKDSQYIQGYYLICPLQVLK